MLRLLLSAIISVFLTGTAATAQATESMVFFWAQDVESSELRALGSGFLIDREGLILTARHVVEGVVEGEAVVVSISSKSNFPRQIDDRLIRCAAAGEDICLVRVPPDAVPATINEVFSLECGRVVAGTPVQAMGFVGGGDRFGGVQQQGGHVTGSPVSGGLIPTDLPLVPTMSGGPVLNADGHVIGVIKGADSMSDNLTFFTPLTAATTILLNAGVGCPQPSVASSTPSPVEEASGGGEHEVEFFERFRPNRTLLAPGESIVLVENDSTEHCEFENSTGVTQVAFISVVSTNGAPCNYSATGFYRPFAPELETGEHIEYSVVLERSGTIRNDDLGFFMEINPAGDRVGRIAIDDVGQIDFLRNNHVYYFSLYVSTNLNSDLPSRLELRFERLR